MMPIAVPMITPDNNAYPETFSETPAPWMMRDKTSRPKPSLPKMYSPRPNPFFEAIMYPIVPSSVVRSKSALFAARSFSGFVCPHVGSIKLKLSFCTIGSAGAIHSAPTATTVMEINMKIGITGQRRSTYQNCECNGRLTLDSPVACASSTRLPSPPSCPLSRIAN